ncbi:hypothetical protein E2C01_007078 [Portunus trituberculatus]|uniref:Ionotropic glutamate receptor C-terminal domain-containing protein n=1 Tax=Portunus trituberculatus TaxID=210409 RepID=A0A5B7CZX1_PORTR|nr:hypothetical protein [Portunus trituberculatus]
MSVSYRIRLGFGPTAVWVDEGAWMWQRVVLGMWMLMTMVLTRSYEGNLMSLLAVRHLPQPYQTLRDVVDDPSVVMVWEKQGAPIQAVIDATSGIFYEVKKSEEQGRLKAIPVYTFSDILEEVISQRKVILDYELVLTVIRSNHFSRTARSNSTSSDLDRFWSAQFCSGPVKGWCELTIKASCELTERFHLCLKTQGDSHNLPSKDSSPLSYLLHTHLSFEIKRCRLLYYPSESPSREGTVNVPRSDYSLGIDH